jgi:hypothetical protein
LGAIIVPPERMLTVVPPERMLTVVPPERMVTVECSDTQVLEVAGS